MRKSLISLSFAALMMGAAFSVLMTPAPAADAQESPSLDSRFEKLRTMSADARRAALQKMSPEERRGLWFRLKRAQMEERTLGTGQEKPTGVQRLTHEKKRSNLPSKAAAGTIQYDDGVGSITFPEQSSPSQVLRGNRFNTYGGGNPVTASGTVDTVVAVVKPGASPTFSSAGFVLYNEQLPGGGAMAIYSTFTDAGTGATETVTFGGIGANYVGTSFLVLFGNFDGSYVPAFGTGTTQGQGYHGLKGQTGGLGPQITTATDLTTVNALIRVTGTVLPTELMDYEVE